LTDFRLKYFVHTLDLPGEKDLKSIGNALSSSSYVRRKMYFDDDCSEREIDLRSKFDGINIENSILRGLAKQ
jgi:hypothetical protein